MKTIRSLYPSCPIILLVELGDHQAKTEALACGMRAVLATPVSLVNLQRAIPGILDRESEPGAPVQPKPEPEWAWVSLNRLEGCRENGFLRSL